MAKKKTGRPRKKIDLEVAEKLGSILCTIKECAAFMDINENTLKTREDFLAAWKKGKEKGKISLRRYQMRMAEKNATMSIWLGKQYLDQKDKQELEHSGNIKTTQINVKPAK